MRPSLQGYVTAVLGGVPASSIAQVATELRGVHDLVSDNVELFTALTDTAVPAAVRRAVLAELLDGKVSEPTRRVAVFAAGAVTAPEVPPAIDWVCVHAGQMADGDVRPVPSLGLLEARNRVGGFATAVFEELPTAELDDVEDELFRFARVVDQHPTLRRALGDPLIARSERGAIVRDLLSDKCEAATVRLLVYLVTAAHSRDLVGTIEWLAELAAEERGRRVAEVRSAVELDDAERRRLAAALERTIGHTVEVRVIVDPAVLGGMSVAIGATVIDGTVRHRLDQLRETLAPTGAGGLGAGTSSNRN